MARVFTVYNCGTGFNRDRTDELIANLASITVGQQAVLRGLSPLAAWMINDGPGSVPKPGSRAKTPGSGPFKVARGLVSGHGWDENVAGTMEILRMLAGRVDVVNMAGWSRGAVTCHMLAHALKNDPVLGPRIRVNIFAVDPVAGPGNRADVDKTTLPNNVDRYHVVISEHESRAIMKPVDVRTLAANADEMDAEYRLYHIPGAHDTGVMKGTPAGKLVWYLAHKFLTSCGTELTKPLELSSFEICELYAGMRYYMPAFEQMRGTAGAALGRESRQVQNEYLRHHFWVNDHHVQHFLKAFPLIGKLLLHPNPNYIANVDTHPHQFEAELSRMRNVTPWTATAMSKAGLIRAVPTTPFDKRVVT